MHESEQRRLDELLAASRAREFNACETDLYWDRGTQSLRVLWVPPMRRPSPLDRVALGVIWVTVFSIVFTLTFVFGGVQL